MPPGLLLFFRKGEEVIENEIICHSFYGGHDITLIPVSDVHLGARECREEEFRKFVASVANTPNVYVSLGGDLIDNGTRNGITNVFQATMPPHQQKREMANILAPVRDRILCFVPGNHEARSGKDADDDPLYDIACKLDLENLYRENFAIVKIQLGINENKNGNRPNTDYRPTYTCVVSHGNGGGMLPGAAINRGQRFGYIFDGCDLLVLGHTHVPYNIKYAKIKIDPRNNKVTEEYFKVLCATSWLEYGGYAARKGLTPAAFAEQTCVLSGKHKNIRITME